MSFKNAVAKLAKLGFKVAENDPLAKRLDDIVQSMDPQAATKGLSGLNPAQQNTIITSYKKFIDARPDGMNETVARNFYLKTVREEAFPAGKLGDEAFRTYRQQLIDGVRVSRGKDPLPPRATPESNITKPKDEAPLSEREIELQYKRADELKAAHQNIRASILDMRKVHNTNGKLDQTSFFGDLANSLHESNLLALTTKEIEDATGKARPALSSPEQVFKAIERREPITESELGTLSDYFGRHHQDPKLATPPQQNIPANMPFGAQNRVIGSVEALVRNVHIKEGKATKPTAAQNYEWETGKVPGVIMRTSSDLQEKPFRTGASLLAKGALAVYLPYAITTTALTPLNPEEPYWHGKHFFAVLTADQHKEVDDYAEYLLDRYNTNTKMALDDLKKYYGVDVKLSKDGKLGPEASEAILKGTVPPYEPSGYVTQALTMFVSQRTLGKALATSEEMQKLIKTTADEGQQAIVKKAKEGETASYQALAQRLSNGEDITTPPASLPARKQRLDMEQVFDDLTRDNSLEMEGKKSVLESAWKKASKDGAVDSDILEQELKGSGINPSGRQVVKSWAAEYNYGLGQ